MKSLGCKMDKKKKKELWDSVLNMKITNYSFKLMNEKCVNNISNEQELKIFLLHSKEGRVFVF